MSDEINVQFVYGAGNDSLFGGALSALRQTTMAHFGSAIYCPRILDWTESATLDRLVGQWKDPTVLVSHSCGGWTIGRAAVANSMKRIPFFLAIAPSMYCTPQALTPNVGEAVQASSWAWDFFNPGSRLLIGLTPTNDKTQVRTISTGRSHLTAPSAPVVWENLKTGINKALKGLPNA